MIRVGIDTGGTFTDVVVVDDETGAIQTWKTPSTPHDPAEGVLHALRSLEGIGMVAHGTTVATNQLLQGDVGRLGFITTEGFEHLLEIARQSVPDGYGNSYFWVKPPRIVPADLVRAVGGRLDHTGAEMRPLSEEDVRRAGRYFRERGVEAIGVCLLHAYANPDHERRVREILAEVHPDAVISLSTDVLREYREYERAMTTLVDAAVKVRVAAYVARIRIDAPLFIMQSNGGVLPAEDVVRQPLRTILSGPAAGALGAAMVSHAAGFERVITLDGGGTSTDVSLVRDGEPTLTTEGSVGGYPCTIPMIDIVTVGAGGGSVAWANPEGTLSVGPRSAGADPGPMCYGRGGTEPTVTDAHLVLGRIPPHLLGGEIPLDIELARQGLQRLGERLGLTVEAIAQGILEISAWNQANALRQITVQRGLDVRDFALVTFGGSGSLLLCRLLDIVGVPVGVVPRDPGNLSAFGLLTVDVKVDHVQTALHRDVATVFGQLRARVRHGSAQLSADLRYHGQAFEVRVPFLGLEETEAAFHSAHERLYGYCFRDKPTQRVEWVNLRATGVSRMPRPALAKVESGPMPAPTGKRQEATIYWRPDLPAGACVEGPAVIEEYGATVPLDAGFAATVDGFGNLVVRRS